MTRIFSRLAVPKPSAAIHSIRLTVRSELWVEMAFAATAAGGNAVADRTAEIEVPTAA